MITFIAGLVLSVIAWIAITTIGRRTDGRAAWEISRHEWLCIYGSLLLGGMALVLLLLPVIDLFLPGPIGRIP